MTVPVLYRIILTLQALADLEEIYAYIAKDSPSRAASVIEKILDAIDSLEIFPHRNIVERQSAKVRSPIRSLPVKPFVIYFRVIDDRNVVIIRHIQHGARRPPKRFD